MVKTLERHRYALCEKHVIVPFCCSYQVYRYLAGCFGLISCRHYLDNLKMAVPKLQLITKDNSLTESVTAFIKYRDKKHFDGLIYKLRQDLYK